MGFCRYQEGMDTPLFSPSLELLGASAPVRPGGREGLPLYLSPVEAGFPSPAEDDLDSRLDLHEYLVRNEAATFFLRAHGDSMLGAGIHDGDLLIVDRSVEAGHRRVVIAALDGELTVKRLLRRAGRVLLAPENPCFSPIDITEREYVHIWGVVTHVIHKL
ncbi:LexA family transcriptional regulator [Desulfovibrio fairfieldensis]|uniref:Peptidase S24/S26A/S26B n=1 Tax=Desulfovibrio fairfieldensis TaxID=44742 RepID=A0A109W4D0_9BACT|nr:translesion error-prone DNA polymerase V autoproteolytic subunit [Desulfovibrio fairfieldensis]AMD90246.1 peptidase S24/S26A/S26B [Desulfovibrio fairfieldensis]